MIKNLIKIMLIVSIAGMVFASAGKSSTEIRGQMRYIPFDNSRMRSSTSNDSAKNYHNRSPHYV